MKIQTTLFASALYGCLLPISAAHAMISDDSCSSDLDCPADTYCAFESPQLCESDAVGGDCLQDDTGVVEGVCIPLEIDDACTQNADCGEGFHCEIPGATCLVFCPEDGDCSDECAANEVEEGVCVKDPVFDTTDCESDDDCGAGQHCEWYEWVAPAENQEDDVPTWNGGGICVDDYDYDPNACWSEWDCGPGFRCEGMYGDSCVHGEDGRYHCEEVTQPGYCVEQYPPDGLFECYEDADCGDGGACIAANMQYDCPEGADCMIPVMDFAGGYCEYDIWDDEEPAYCVVRVYDECVIYADEGTGLNCDATASSPTWLAFLAIFGLIRRRTHQR